MRLYCYLELIGLIINVFSIKVRYQAEKMHLYPCSRVNNSCSRQHWMQRDSTLIGCKQMDGWFFGCIT